MNGRELVLDILLTLEREGEYSHRLMKSALDKVDYLESNQKAFMKRLAEGTLERGLELDYYLDCYSSLPVRKMKPLIRCLMRMSVYQLLYMDSVPDSAVCNEACKLCAKRGFGNLKGFVNGVLRRIARNKRNLPLPDKEKKPVQYLSVRYSMPEWLVELWLEEYGREITVTLLENLMEIHPVSIRFSSRILREEQDSLCEEMRARGVEITQGPYLPYMVLARHTENPAALPGFEEGRFTVQDVSSALAVEAAGIRDGDFVVDVCAAPGGKSALAAEKAGCGKVLARDVSEEKTERIQETVSRMGLKNVEVQVYDGAVRDESLEGKADVVLLDVPCSGLGVMGKKRDIKYRVTPQGVREICGLQRRIVRASAAYVKPGGILLYSTCTIHSKENEEMALFIRRELGLEPVSLEGRLPEALLEQKRGLEQKRREAGKASCGGLTEEEAGGCLQLLPGYMEADGFFLACFRRPKVSGNEIGVCDAGKKASGMRPAPEKRRRQ